MSQAFLKVKQTNIVDEQNQKVMLKGVNFGGWLMMEAYFMHAPNTAEQLMKREFSKVLGAQALTELESSFRRNFIQESDMRQVSDFGFNCVRLPFNYRLIESKSNGYNLAGLKYIDDVIDWASKYGVYVMLDLHAAPGAQNHDWHSDSLGRAELWTKKSNRAKVYKLWEFLADRYKDEPMVAGYDLLNEPVLDDAQLLNEFYRESIKAIRRCDKKHILFVEGKHWAQDISVLDDFADDNWAYSIHYYEPLEFSFNFVPHIHYPLKSKAGVWDKDVMRRRMDGYYQFAKKHGRPIHVGEFGVNYRDGLYNEHTYVKDLIKVFKDFGFHWNYWTYKAVKHYMFPDGIFSYYANPPWVNRAGPVSGWNRWKDLWPKHKKEMIASWRTEAFTLNEKVLKALC